MIIVFIVAIVLCVGLVISALCGLLLPYMLLVLALAIVMIIIMRVYKIKEKVAKRKGNLALGEVVSVKHVFDGEVRSYYLIKFKYLDENNVERERQDLVHYTEEEMEMLELEDGEIEIVVHKSFAVALNPYEVQFVKAKREELREKEKIEEEELNKELEDEYHKNAEGDKLKECPYCGYKTFEDNFKCPMCGGDLDFKKKKKTKKKVQKSQE